MEGSTYHVAIVQEGFDAAGKLMPGDHIVEVDHKPMYGPTTESLREAVNAKGGAPIVLTVDREGKKLDVTIQPKLAKDKDGKDQLDEKTGKPAYRLGVIQQADVEDVGIFTAAGAAFVYPIEQTKMIVGGLYDIITQKEKADPGGPIRMVDEFKKAFSNGFVTGIRLLMLLSVYLGLFNLFPLPALDGGRLVFLGYEMVTRRRANPKIEATVHMGGIMILAVVMVLVTLHDCHVI
jgi:regulator of sigma E protease